MSKKRKESQNDRILAYLKSGKSLTQKDAVELFNCYRLSARIADLRKDGHAIRTDNVFKGSIHYAKYRLEDEKSVQV